MPNKTKKRLDSMRVRYIQCHCWDMEDLTAITFDPDPDFPAFYFEYKLCRRPTVSHEWPRGLWNKIENYFLGIWFAIRGLPVWHTAQPTYTPKEAKKMAKFITDSLAGKKVGEEWGSSSDN